MWTLFYTWRKSQPGFARVHGQSSCGSGLLDTVFTATAKSWRWVAKLIARLLATAALWIRIQTSLKNTKWVTKAKEWPTHYRKELVCTSCSIHACRPGVATDHLKILSVILHTLSSLPHFPASISFYQILIILERPAFAYSSQYSVGRGLFCRSRFYPLEQSQ